MALDPKKRFSKTQTTEGKPIKSVEIITVVSPSVNQDKIEAQNLERLKKSLKELILEKEGGSIKKNLKTFSLK
jgi:hypothetical protein